ncbi:MAG: hypothetical protein P8J87_19165 [Verrucomicrobiales bacterium]|nr:hypothetical protein [Verrucomicrobiales bacterium]
MLSQVRLPRSERAPKFSAATVGRVASKRSRSPMWSVGTAGSVMSKEPSEPWKGRSRSRVALRSNCGVGSSKPSPQRSMPVTRSVWVERVTPRRAEPSTMSRSRRPRSAPTATSATASRETERFSSSK